MRLNKIYHRSMEKSTVYVKRNGTVSYETDQGKLTQAAKILDVETGDFSLVEDFQSLEREDKGKT